MTDLAIKFKLLDCFVERHAVIPPHMCILPPFYSSILARDCLPESHDLYRAESLNR